jgi:hypothetical protein
MPIEDNLSAAGIPYPVAAEILNGLKVGGSTSSGALVALGVPPPAAEELARQVNARTGSAHLLTNSGFPPEASNQIRNTINGILQIGRPLLSSSRLQVLSSRVQVTSADIYKMRIIAETSAPWQEYGKSFAFAAWYGNEQPLGNDWPIKAAMVEIGDKQYPLTVNGQEVFTVPDGTAVWTDELPVIIPANAVIRIGVADELAVNQYRPSQGPVYLPRSVIATPSNRGDAINTSGTVSQVANLKANTGEFFTNTPGVAIYDGLPILSTSRPYGEAAIAMATAILSVGDSIEWGDRTTGMPYGVTAEELGVPGFLQRAYNTMPGGRIPFGSMGVPSTRLLDLTLSPTAVGVAIKGFDKRRALLQAKGWPFDVILCEMGLNSATNGNATTVVADAKAAHAQLKSMGGKPVIQTLLLPCSLSSDDPSTTANAFNWTSADASKQFRQAPSSIDAFNAYIKGTPTDVDGFIELAPAVESSAGSGKWANIPAQNGRLTADAASGQRTAILNFAPLPGDGLMVGVGDATNIEFRDVMTTADNGNGTWTVNFRQTFGKPHVANTDTSVVTVGGVNTADGIHVTTQGARKLKERVRAASSLLRRAGSTPTIRLRNVASTGLVNIAAETRPSGSPRDLRIGYVPQIIQADCAYLEINWHGWRIQALEAAPEVMMPADVTIDAMSAQLGSVSVPVTQGGFRTIVNKAGQFCSTADRLYASAFGKAKFQKGDMVWLKYTYRLAETQAAYTIGQTMRPGGGQAVICCSANYADAVTQVDTVGTFRAPTTYNDGTTNWSPQPAPIMVPNLILGEPQGGERSAIVLGDSITFRLSDRTGDGRFGGSWAKRGSITAGKPLYTCAIGGFGSYHYAIANTMMRQLWQFFDVLVLAQGGNDVSNGKGYAATLANRQTIKDHFLAANAGKRTDIIESTITPRVSNGATYNGNTVYRATDLVNQTPYYTQAPGGLGFEAGGTKDQLNAYIRANAAKVVDLAARSEAPGDTTKWALRSFSTTLKNAASVNASSIVLNDAPIIGESLVIEPGGATTAVDPRGAYTQSDVNNGQGNTAALNVVEVSGNASSGYTVQFYPSTDTTAGGVAVIPPTLNFAHAAGAVVKATNSQDETHPTALIHTQVGADFAAILAALPLAA